MAKRIILLFVIITIITKVFSVRDVDKAWTNFKNTYSKRYQSPADEAFRKSIFVSKFNVNRFIDFYDDMTQGEEIIHRKKNLNEQKPFREPIIEEPFVKKHIEPIYLKEKDSFAM